MINKTKSIIQKPDLIGYGPMLWLFSKIFTDIKIQQEDES